MRKLPLSGSGGVYQNPLSPGRPMRRLARPSRRLAREAVYHDNYSHHARMKRIPPWVGWGVAVVAFVLITQSFFQLPFFAIDTVHLRGLRYIAEEDVRSFIMREMARRRLVIFKNGNFFIVSLSRLQDRLEEEFYVNVTAIAKDFPDTLIVDIDERVSAFVLQTPERYIAINAYGEWVGEVGAPTKQQMVIADERVTPGASVAISYLEKATSLQEEWARLIPQVHLSRLHLTDDAILLQLSTDKNYRVFFHADKDIAAQVKRLSLFLSDTSVVTPREYIDLRFDESVYVK